MKKYSRVIWMLACFILFTWTPLGTGYVMNLTWVKCAPDLEDNIEQFRKMQIAPSRLAKYRLWSEEEYCGLVRDFLFYQGKIMSDKKRVSSFSWYGLLLPEKKVTSYVNAWKKAFTDVQCFPVQDDIFGKETVSYEDSWGTSRTYGGNRRHEGTDLMTSNNERGYFSVVSVSDGVVEKMGWLKLGGYRVGIRSPGGTYFYYAHLESYADDLEEGSAVKAGQIIGKMGDSGYGKEGTIGRFQVHLHFGIYIQMNKKDVSVNPYPILKTVETEEKR